MVRHREGHGWVRCILYAEEVTEVTEGPLVMQVRMQAAGGRALAGWNALGPHILRLGQADQLLR